MSYDLKALHGEILASLAALEDMSCGSLPDRKLYSDARIRLARANSVRTALIERLCVEMLPIATPEEMEHIQMLGKAAVRRMLWSSEFVRRWTLDAVFADWAGYRIESAKVRTATRVQIEVERKIVYPLLERHHQRRSAPVPSLRAAA